MLNNIFVYFVYIFDILLSISKFDLLIYSKKTDFYAFISLFLNILKLFFQIILTFKQNISNIILFDNYAFVC